MNAGRIRRWVERQRNLWNDLHADGSPHRWYLAVDVGSMGMLRCRDCKRSEFWDEVDFR